MDVLLTIRAMLTTKRGRDVLLSAFMRVLWTLRVGKVRLLKRMLTFTAISAVYTTIINFQFVRKSFVRRLIIMALTIFYADKRVFYSPNISNRLQLVLACVAVSSLNKVSSLSRRASVSQKPKLQHGPSSTSSMTSGAFHASARWREARAPSVVPEVEEEVDPQDALHDEERIRFFIAKFLLKKFQGKLSVEDLRELFDQLTHMVVEGPVLWKGSPNGMYIIRRGVLGIYKGDTLLTRLTRGESTGDLRVLCPMIDTSKSPLECRIISGPAHLSFISAEDFESYMSENVQTLHVYVSASIGTYWRLVRFVLQEVLAINEATLSLDVLSTDVQDLRHLPNRRITEGMDLVFESDSAVFLTRGSLLVNGTLVHSPAVIGAAALLAGLQPSGTVRCVGAKNCHVSDIKVEHLCYFHTLVSLASLLVHDCDLFMRLGLSRHFIPQGRPLPQDCHLLIGGRLGARHTKKIKSKPKWFAGDETSIQEIGGVTLVGTEYLHERRSDARYFALRDSECVRITRAAYHAIIEFDPSTGLRLADLVHKARDRTHGVNASIVGVIFLSEVSADEAAEATKKMEDVFESDYIDVRLVRQALGERHNDAFTRNERSYRYDMAAAWLADREKKSTNKTILLGAHLSAHAVAGESENLFAQFVITHCDRVLLVAAPDSSKVSLAEEQLFRNSIPHTDLVILQNGPPNGTRFLLEPRPYVAFHHHVINMDMRDFARVRRYVTGNTTGLILGGGGARGLTHLGVFKALEEQQQEIDFIGGTSQGAFMGAILAGHYRDLASVRAAVLQFCALMSSKIRLLMQGTLPIVSIADGRKFTEYVRQAMPTEYIEDCHIPYFCTSSNVTTARVMYHHEGLLWKYVRASMTIIGVLPPVWDDGDLLVDGGYLDNLPVLYMREILGPQSTIIAVDVENKDVSHFESVSAYEDGLSGTYLFVRRLLTFLFGAKPFRHPAKESIISQLTYAEHIVRLEHCLATDAIDLYIRPPFLDSVWLLDFHLVKKLERRGYLHSRGCLEKFYSGPNSAKEKENDKTAALNNEKAVRTNRRMSEISPVRTKSPNVAPRGSVKAKASQKQPLMIRCNSVHIC